MADVSLTVSVPEADAVRITSAFCAKMGVQPATPEAAVLVVKEAVFHWLASETINYEAQQAARSVLSNANDPLAQALLTEG